MAKLKAKTDQIRYDKIGLGPREKIIPHLACLFARLLRYIHRHISRYAPADVPCLILYKTGEPKSGAILWIYLLPWPFTAHFLGIGINF